MKATAKDLRFQTNDLLNSVKRGEEVIISYHGKPCAKLIPLEDPEIEENDLFGIWQDNEQIDDINEHVRNLRKGRQHVD
ncbi:MAG: type II toxin-antitoxin system prevent-host-death family antitoxin [Proteobacteria bacterium]|nr:type II toxin-antitoxin system prevent-host-death family antitoxin [Pseudomonadota bacterium]